MTKSYEKLVYRSSSGLGSVVGYGKRGILVESDAAWPPTVFDWYPGSCGNHFDPNLSYDNSGGALTGGPTGGARPKKSGSYEEWGYSGPHIRTSEGTWPFHRYVRVYYDWETAGKVKSLTWTGSTSYAVDGTDFLQVSALMPRLKSASDSEGVYHYLYLGILDSDGFADLIAPKLYELEAKLFRKELEKDALIADLGTTLVEIRELKKLFYLSDNVFREILETFKKVDFTSPKGLWNFLVGLSQGWLTWSYALKPLFELIKDLVKNAHRAQGLNLEKRSVKGKIGSTISIYERWHNPVYDPGPTENSGPPYNVQCSIGPATLVEEGGWHREIYFADTLLHSDPPKTGPVGYWRTTKVDVTLRMRWYITTDWTFLFKQLNLDNPALLVWEYLPFSFIIDWFGKVGEYLASHDLLNSLRITDEIGAYTFVYDITTSAGSRSRRTVKYRELHTSALADSPYQTFGPWIPDVPFGYGPLGKVNPGTMVSKLDDRARNAASLLVVLSNYWVQLIETINQWKQMELHYPRRYRFERLISKLESPKRPRA